MHVINAAIIIIIIIKYNTEREVAYYRNIHTKFNIKSNNCQQIVLEEGGKTFSVSSS